jgi:uncharacterized membrane protein YjjB (DUF3815 family)
MNIEAIGIGSLLAAVFAAGLAILLVAPPRSLASAFLCGGAGHLVRDLSIGWGVTAIWSTSLGAAVVVLVAVAVLREHVISPVILISGVLPLGASVAVFNTIRGLMNISTLEGEALGAASTALSANLGKVFTTTLAIAMGLAAGMAIVRLVRRERIWRAA